MAFFQELARPQPNFFLRNGGDSVRQLGASVASQPHPKPRKQQAQQPEKQSCRASRHQGDREHDERRHQLG